MSKKNILKMLLPVLALLLIISMLSGCQKVSFIPGASYGYYIWEEDDGIHISWSIDRKDAEFSGSIDTDGDIDDVQAVSWEEADELEVAKDEVSYDSTLDAEDYTDGMVIRISDYSYIEMDLKINDGYDPSRVHLGVFLNNPEDIPFRIKPGYFAEAKDIPWYERHPFSGFFYKLFANKFFTFPFIFIIGVVVIELLRVTAFSEKRLRKFYTGISYAVLVCLEAAIYFMLRFFVL